MEKVAVGSSDLGQTPIQESTKTLVTFSTILTTRIRSSAGALRPGLPKRAAYSAAHLGPPIHVDAKPGRARRGNH